jgi:hypothetical protein
VMRITLFLSLISGRPFRCEQSGMIQTIHRLLIDGLLPENHGGSGSGQPRRSEPIRSRSPYHLIAIRPQTSGRSEPCNCDRKFRLLEFHGSSAQM